MHSSGLHVYYPEENEKKNMGFMNTVSQNKQALPKGKSSKPKQHGSYMANYSSHPPRTLGG